MTPAHVRPADDGGGEDRVSLGEVERQLRELLGSNAGEAKIAAVAAGVGAAALGVVSVYLLGRRKGRKRASVLEIRRV
ncbi:MAG: hypothetical protein WB383_06185 [Acidimicrobiales bacterium]